MNENNSIYPRNLRIKNFKNIRNMINKNHFNGNKKNLNIQDHIFNILVLT